MKPDLRILLASTIDDFATVALVKVSDAPTVEPDQILTSRNPKISGNILAHPPHICRSRDLRVTPQFRAVKLGQLF
ncbi:MAG: hypothetical protein IPJ30_16550 [Acidobacteria bacterium]|nr:hypothetical protein [Acidobacteriota bacterium]